MNPRLSSSLFLPLCPTINQVVCNRLISEITQLRQWLKDWRFAVHCWKCSLWWGLICLQQDKNDEKILIPFLDNWHIIPFPYPYSQLCLPLRAWHTQTNLTVPQGQSLYLHNIKYTKLTKFCLPSELLESSSNAPNLTSSGMLSWSLQLGAKDSKKGVID